MTFGGKPSGNEGIKEKSDYLRGTISAELDDLSTPQVSDATYELLKFHGSYFGYDRDTATERKKAGLEKEYEFMVRMKCPAGRLTAEQYLRLDELVGQYANNTLRITTRETFQFHVVLKQSMKPLIGEINKALLSTLGGCGDVNRNVITCPAPIKDNIHAVLEAGAYKLAAHLAPKTHAYHEIWCGEEKLNFGPDKVIEPIYGEHYMPRKFKIALGQPEDNCMDMMTNDLALIALFNGQELYGYNVALGGGLGMNHNNAATYPRLATPLAFVKPEDLVNAAESVVKLQRDHGDRNDRKHARLKYVVQEKGLEWTKKTLDGYFGREMENAKPMPKFAVVDHQGWNEQGDGKWFLGIPVSSGRIIDRGEECIKTGLREVIKEYKTPVILTADQNIILADIPAGEKRAITEKLKKHGIKLREDLSEVYRNFIACVALPTCGKALAEAERVKLPLVSEIEKLMVKHQVEKEKITIRMAGCPNGCPRPYVGDIGIVGRMPDHYVIYIGGDFEGTRLNKKVFDKVPLAEVPQALDSMLGIYAKNKNLSEGFGDFCERYGVEAVLSEAKKELTNYKWVN